MEHPDVRRVVRINGIFTTTRGASVTVITSVRIMEATDDHPVVPTTSLTTRGRWMISGILAAIRYQAVPLASAERMAASGKQSLRDAGIGRMSETHIAASALMTHFGKPTGAAGLHPNAFFWSVATPLAGIRYVDWREFRKIEAESPHRLNRSTSER